MRKIKSMEEKYQIPALDLVEAVFTAHESTAEGRLIRRLVDEIRSKALYVPELELIMTDEQDSVIGYCMFSRFRLEGRHERELLLLSPVAVKTELQRQHISKELIEYGFRKAASLGYKAVIVEGNPQNYRARGFVTSGLFGITAHESVGVLRYNLFWQSIPFLDLIYIDEAYRAKGWRSKMMAYWEESMHRMGYPHVMLSTLEDETAKFFYEKIGYRRIGAFLPRIRKRMRSCT